MEVFLHGIGLEHIIELLKVRYDVSAICNFMKHICNFINAKINSILSKRIK